MGYKITMDITKQYYVLIRYIENVSFVVNLKSYVR